MLTILSSWFDIADIPGPFVTIPFIISLVAKWVYDFLSSRRTGKRLVETNQKIDDIKTNVTPSNGTPTAQIVERLEKKLDDSLTHMSRAVGDLNERLDTMSDNQLDMLDIMARHIDPEDSWDGITERRQKPRE